MENESLAEKPKTEEVIEILAHAFDRLEIGQQEMRDEMQEGFRRLSGEIGGVKDDVAFLKEDVGTLKTDVGTLKTDVGTLKTDVRGLAVKIDDLRTELKGDIADLAEQVAEGFADHETRITALEKR